MSQILEFKQKLVKLSAICNTCNQSWQTEMPESRYLMYLNKGKRCICPFCGHTEIGLARDVSQ